MNRGERATMVVFLLCCLVSIGIVVHWKGLAQLGNAMSFLGGIGTIIPALSQFRTNRRYIETIVIDAGADFAELDRALEAARREEFMRFSHFDYGLFSAGLLLMCAGFLVSILTAPNA